MSLLRWSLALPASECLPGADQRVLAIVRQHLDLVYRMARRLGVTSWELEDVTQEVLLVVVRRIEAIDPSKERAFVAATTLRVTANWRRQRRRRPEQPSDQLELLHSLDTPQLPRTTHAHGEQGVERARKLELLQGALAAMTEQQRETFILFELEQLTAREIAEQLRLPEAAVVSRVRRARAAFAKSLQQQGRRGEREHQAVAASEEDCESER
ncbi:MAG TPA: sigma-70 family RNA polymerase sigma factor [Polyangiaceae bacterium]|nr:sigma-70 family RNA polymerase sigma factor [Polyangiaceae bacterium]